MELGASTVIIYGFREREKMLDLFEMITGLRMNHAYIRPGGVAQDLPPGAVEKIREFLARHAAASSARYGRCSTRRRSYIARTKGVGYLDLTGCMALGVTGPMLRAAGLPWDLRKSQPYCGYETYEFDVPTGDDVRRRTAGTWSGWTRCASRCGSSSSAWTGSLASARRDR